MQKGESIWNALLLTSPDVIVAMFAMSLVSTVAMSLVFKVAIVTVTNASAIANTSQDEGVLK